MEILFLIVGGYFLLRVLREIAMMSAFWRRRDREGDDE